MVVNIGCVWKSSEVRAAALWTWAAALLACCSGAGGSPESHGQTPVAGLAHLEPGAVAVTCSPEPARFSFSAGARKVESASEGAGRAARAVLSATPDLGNSQLECAVGAFECVLAPFAAAYGALSSARLRMSPDQLADAERDLSDAMGVMARQQHLRQAVFRGAGEKTHRRLISLDPGAMLPAGEAVSALLETQVEELRLQRLGSGDSKFDLRVRARARLMRASDGAVLCDRAYDYRSGCAMFIDWTRHDGLASVARTGYRQIAEDMVRDFFPAAESQPVVLGRGHPVLSAPKPSSPPGLSATSNTLAAFSQTEGRPGIRSVDSEPPYPRSATFSLESPAYPRRQPKAQTQEPEVSGAAADADRDLDGLEDDPNLMVQSVAGLAAVPVGLWEKTVGALGEGARKRFETVGGRFQEVAWNLKPERVLAGELVRILGQLASRPAGEVGAPQDAPTRGDPSSAPSPDSRAPALERQDPEAVVVRTGAGTAAEIRVTNVELERRPGLRARVALRLEARATLLRLSDGQELCSWPLQYLGQERRLEDWNGKARRSFQEELAHGCREMAAAVARELVSQGVVSPGASGTPGKGESEKGQN